VPEVRVSALGTEAVVDGGLAAAAELAWAQLTVALPAASDPYGHRPDGHRRDGLAGAVGSTQSP
jgi:hypothetical protein